VLETILAGLGAGLVLSAPVGPMGALAAYEAAGGRLRSAWLLAMGGCAADTLLALLATWGTELPIPEFWLHGMMALVMLSLGGYLLLTARQPAPPLKDTAGLWMSFGATLLHPANLLAFGLAFKWLDGQGLVIDGMVDRLLLTAGVLGGAVAIWSLVIEVAKRMGENVKLGRFQVRLKLGLGMICLMAGAWALLSMV
jgi:hypothetical protein